MMFARGALWDPSIFLSKPQGASSCSYPSSFAANGLVVEGDSSKTSSPSHLANVCPSSSSGRKAAGDATSAGGGKGIEQPHPRHPPLLAGPPPRLALLRDYVKQVTGSRVSTYYAGQSPTFSWAGKMNQIELSLVMRPSVEVCCVYSGFFVWSYLRASFLLLFSFLLRLLAVLRYLSYCHTNGPCVVGGVSFRDICESHRGLLVGTQSSCFKTQFPHALSSESYSATSREFDRPVRFAQAVPAVASPPSYVCLG